MNERAVIGGNSPPEPIDPIDAALAPYDAERQEAEGWLDGKPVENVGQMEAVDALRASMREARQAVEKAEEATCKPLFTAWKTAKARFKPTLDDLGRIEGGLVSLVEGFKVKLAVERAEEDRKARMVAAAAQAAAAEAARRAEAGNIEATRAAAAALDAAKAAEKAAAEAKKGQVKGLRTVQRHEVEDERAALFWIAEHDRPALAGFVAEYASTHPGPIAGVRRWAEKVAV